MYVALIINGIAILFNPGKKYLVVLNHSTNFKVIVFFKTKVTKTECKIWPQLMKVWNNQTLSNLSHQRVCRKVLKLSLNNAEKKGTFRK